MAELCERLRAAGRASAEPRPTSLDQAFYGDDAKPFGLEKWALDRGIEIPIGDDEDDGEEDMPEATETVAEAAKTLLRSTRGNLG